MAASIRVCCTLRLALRGELFSFVVTAQTHICILMHIYFSKLTLFINVTVAVHDYLNFSMSGENIRCSPVSVIAAIQIEIIEM